MNKEDILKFIPDIWCNEKDYKPIVKEKVNLDNFKENNEVKIILLEIFKRFNVNIHYINLNIKNPKVIYIDGMEIKSLVLYSYREQCYFEAETEECNYIGGDLIDLLKNAEDENYYERDWEDVEGSLDVLDLLKLFLTYDINKISRI